MRTRNKANQQRLLVLIPPAWASAEDYSRQGFILAVKNRGIAARIQTLDIGPAEVMAGQASACVHQLAIQPALAAGADEIWLVGISLGASIALGYAAQQHKDLAAPLSLGLCLLAPYPGPGDVLADLRAAGDMRSWLALNPDARQFSDERLWWHWLIRAMLTNTWPVKMYFAAGRHDRFSAGQALLASLLPPSQVRWSEGDHAWPTWRKLWADWLDYGPLANGGVS